MATINQNDVLELTLMGEFDGTEDVVNVFQFQKTSAGADDFSDVLDDFIGLVNSILNIIKALSSALLVWRRFKLRNITQGVLYGDIAISPEVSGTEGGSALPNGVAFLVTFRTDVSHVVMRKYFGGLTETDTIQPGVFTSTVIGAGADIISLLFNPITSAGRTYQYGTLSSKTGTFKVPQSATAYGEPAYQRRRRRGVGS